MLASIYAMKYLGPTRQAHFGVFSLIMRPAAVPRMTTSTSGVANWEMVRMGGACSSSSICVYLCTCIYLGLSRHLLHQRL